MFPNLIIDDKRKNTHNRRDSVRVRKPKHKSKGKVSYVNAIIQSVTNISERGETIYDIAELLNKYAQEIEEGIEPCSDDPDRIDRKFDESDAEIVEISSE